MDSITNPKYTEILKLREMLNNENIPNSLRKKHDGWQILYGTPRVCSVVQNSFSYGADNNLLEIMGLVTEGSGSVDSVKGFLTAEDVFCRIQKHYEETELEKRKCAKPCPLCGNKTIESEWYNPLSDYKGGFSLWRIACKKCGCNVMGIDKNEATQKWNRRAK